MGINVNLGGVEAWAANAVLSPGAHTVKVIRAEEKAASTGTPQIVLQLEAIDGLEIGGTITDWIAVTENSLGRVRMIMEAFRMEIPEGAFSLEARSFMGHTARIIVRSEPGLKDPTRTFSKVAAYEEADGVAGGVAEGDPLDRVAVPAGNSSVTADDPLDDIPF